MAFRKLILFSPIALYATGAWGQDCVPSTKPIVAICSSSCSAAYCGYQLPLAGKKFRGNFIAYYGRGDNKPITIPNGANEAVNLMRIYVPSDRVSLHFYIDKSPDFSIAVQEKREDNTGEPYESIGNANEDFTLDDLKPGYYIIRIIKKRGTPGGNSANYVPTVYLLPTLRQNSAGAGPDNAKMIGTIAAGPPIVVDENLQTLWKRDNTGQLNGDMYIDNREDWFRFTAPSRGILKAALSFNSTLEPIAEKPTVGYYAGGVQQTPSDIPHAGLLIQAGNSNYIVVKVPTGPIGNYEFSYRYHLELSFTPQ